MLRDVNGSALHLKRSIKTSSISAWAPRMRLHFRCQSHFLICKTEISIATVEKNPNIDTHKALRYNNDEGTGKIVKKIFEDLNRVPTVELGTTH